MRWFITLIIRSSMKPIPGHITQEATHTLNLLLVCHNHFVINYNLNFLNNDVSSSLLQKEMCRQSQHICSKQLSKHVLVVNALPSKTTAMQSTWGKGTVCSVPLRGCFFVVVFLICTAVTFQLTIHHFTHRPLMAIQQVRAMHVYQALKEINGS